MLCCGVAAFFEGNSEAVYPSAVSLFWPVPCYSFVRIHKTLRVTPAIAAGMSDKLWSTEDVVALIDARSAKITGNMLQC